MANKKKRQKYGACVWRHRQTGHFYARVQIRGSDGKIKTITRRAINQTHAKQLADEIKAEYETRRAGFIEGEAMTFSDLADWYLKTHVRPAIYSDKGLKAGGMRTYHNTRLRVERLRLFLGKMLIRDIDEDILLDLKSWLYNQSPGCKPASVNRYLECLRAILNKAIRKRWLKENPFLYGERVIDTALESSREVTISDDQISKILFEAKRAGNSLCYYALVCLADTGARPSEIYNASTMESEPVKWRDFFDFDFKAVRLTSYKGRQKKIRLAPVTERMKTAMFELWNSMPEEERNLDAQIFNFRAMRRSWDGIRKRVGLSDVRIRDLRRTFSTRLAKQGMESHLRQGILGHETPETTFGYTEADFEAVLIAKEALDRANGLGI